MSADVRQLDTLNSLLRGELAAIETYQQALNMVGLEDARPELLTMQDDHSHAVTLLTERVIQAGGLPAERSGLWGVWARIVEGMAKWFGKASAMKALKEGEEHGAKVYRDALQNGQLDPDSQSLIQATLLPRTLAHVPALDRLIEQA
jgi:hypothetical protein